MRSDKGERTICTIATCSSQTVFFCNLRKIRYEFYVLCEQEKCSTERGNACSLVNELSRYRQSRFYIQLVEKVIQTLVSDHQSLGSKLCVLLHMHNVLKNVFFTLRDLIIPSYTHGWSLLRSFSMHPPAWVSTSRDTKVQNSCTDPLITGLKKHRFTAPTRSLIHHHDNNTDTIVVVVVVHIDNYRWTTAFCHSLLLSLRQHILTWNCTPACFYC